MKCPDCGFETCHEAQEVECCRYCKYTCGSRCERCRNEEGTSDSKAIYEPISTD